MLLMVTFVGLLIFIYSQGYMHEDVNYVRFFCFLSLFAASMLGLIIANSLLVLFMCWELVGLCSYLLIGFWYHKPEAAAAARKAFIVTRVGDIGFFIGLLLLFHKTGTLTLYSQVPHPGILDWDWLHVLSVAPPVQLPFVTISLVGLIALLLFIGAMGKSAQFPLHVWLPDAMEGPTPVSALIHAATMVVAGVFLVARMFPLFELSPAISHGVAWVGGITALFAATIAIAQVDIKKVLAYSTISQLGYMMLALGLGGYVAGMFHLIMHAFFKALLFLGAGSVIHGCHGEQNMFRMGGLRKAMPTTFWTYMVGTLALAGIPPLAGFWSKDEVLLTAYVHDKPLYVLGTLVAFLTAFYMFRQIFIVFFGTQRSDSFHPHESPKVMLWPLKLLAILSIVGGLIGTPFLFGNPFHHFIGPTHHSPNPSAVVMVGSVIVALLGIGAAYLIYGKKPVGEKDPLASWLKGLYTLFERKYFLDELYHNIFVRPTASLARFFKGVDQRIIDGLLHLIGSVTLGLSHFNLWCDNFFMNGGFDRSCEGIKGSGSLLKRIQTGRAQDYLLYVAVGAILLLGLFQFLMGR